jgi:hypothetical protein
VTDEQGPVVSGYGLAAVPADPAKWQAGLLLVMEMPAPDGTLKLGSWLPGEYIVAALPTADLVILVRDRSRASGLAAVGTRVVFQKDEVRTVDLRLVRLPDKQ